MTDIGHEFLSAVHSRTGHFRTESGYHTDWWMDLETLCRRPSAIRPFAQALAMRLQPYRVDAVCGPLNEGAFVAMLVAEALDCDFTYAERHLEAGAGGLFPVRYTLPAPLRRVVAGRRVAIINDVVSAGSAVRGTFTDVTAAGGRVVAIAALLVLGHHCDAWAAEQPVPVETLARNDYRLWHPDRCPLCHQRVPLT